MEDFNKIFIPKIDKEEENLESEDKNKENKTEKESSIVVVEIDGVKLEGGKHYFEYPESVQKETGILGYDRTIISNENLNNFIKDYCQNVYNFDIEKYGFTNLESILKIGDELYEIIKKTLHDIEYNYGISAEERKNAEENYRQSKEFQDWGHLNEIGRSLNKKILYNMSDGNYPNKTFNHIISAYSSSGKTDLDNFVKDKFFIQEIYSTNLIKKLSEEGINNIFNSSGDGSAGNKRLTVCKKQTNEMVEPAYKFDDLAKSEYINNLKDGEYFAYNNACGLNFSVGRFFQTFGTEKGAANPSVGFNLKNNDFLSKYLNKVLINNITEILPKNKVDIQELLVDILFMNENIQKILTEKDNNVEFFEASGDSVKRELLKIEVEKIIKQIEEKNNIIIKTYTDKTIDNFVSSIAYRCEQGEVYIPIYIGHDDIPQLCWGHADYGHFINSSGLNFFEFKHDSSVLEKDV